MNFALLNQIFYIRKISSGRKIQAVVRSLHKSVKFDCFTIFNKKKVNINLNISKIHNPFRFKTFS